MRTTWASGWGKMMVELRWVEKGDGHDDSPIERTLQYREFPKGCVTPNIEPVWIDVPVVDWRDRDKR